MFGIWRAQQGMRTNGATPASPPSGAWLWRRHKRACLVLQGQSKRGCDNPLGQQRASAAGSHFTTPLGREINHWFF